MAKTKIDKDDIKRLVENTSNPTSTTSVYSAKYVEDLINTAVVSVYKLKGNIADKTALLDLTNIKQGDVYNAQAEFNLNGQNIKIGDNIVCISDAATSEEDNWDNLCGNETNRTIKVDGIDKAGSLTTTPLNFKSTDDIIVQGLPSEYGLDISFSSNSLLFRGELSDPTLASFQSGNLLNGIYDIVPEKTYEDVPNVSCGTDESKSGMKGSLVSQLNGAGASLVYHCFITNNIYICSGTIDGVTGNIIWSNWKRLLTCKDNNEIPDDLEGSIEGEGYLYQINSSYQRIILNNEDIKNKTVDIDLKLFNSQIGAKLRIIIEFDEVSVNPDINIIDSTTPTKTINYSVSYYTDPYSVANVYRVEYEIYNFSPYWLVSNEIY